MIQPEGETLDPDVDDEAYPGEGVMVNSGPFDGEPTPASIAKVAAWLREEGRGEPAVTFRLRDWLLSRQRYWGAPIPIIHCETCGEVAVPDEELPVLLPDDVDFQPGGESPLARHPSWSKVACPTCGGDARRDTDTMDTFVDSSWYFFRYCSPGFEDGPFRREDIDRWMPADQYTGGVEHAILHLMYCRFFTKALHDFGLIGFIEPFPRLMNQGQVIYGGASMSKTKGNIVEPMPIDRAMGLRLDALDHAVRRTVRGRHRLEADRGRSEQASGRERLAGARVRGDGRGGRARRRRGTSRMRWNASCIGRSRV